MFIRKIEGVRTVKLPNGQVLSQNDLPAKDIKRWVASKKAIVVNAVAYGLIRRSVVLKDYNLSDEEFTRWLELYVLHGEGGLKSTKARKFRQP